MSRKDDKNKEAVISVNIDEFTRTRDNVIVSLATLQSAVSDLSRAYIQHANTVLNRGPPTLEAGFLTSSLAGVVSTGLIDPALVGQRPASPTAKSDTGDKKKRKRAPHDPNAPKRALTPYFLYMQHNRAQIAQELGTNAKPKDVADEGTRRWAEMPDAQKDVWKKLYADNLAVYKEKMKAYKAGLPIPDDDNAKAASQLQQSVAQAEESEEDEAPEPAKAEPVRGGKRRRTTGEVKAAAKDVPSPASTKKTSPEKKKQAAPKGGKAQETPASRKSVGGAADTKRPKKKRKSEVGGEE